jgi:hypothetical protein
VSDRPPRPFDVAQFIQDVTTYLDQADAYTRSDDALDAALLCRQLPPDGSILDAMLGADTHGPYIAVRVRDPDDPTRPVTPRLFDPWWFVVIVLLAIAGVPLVWHKKMQKGEPYFRLMCCTLGDEPQDGIPVTRLIGDTDEGVETRFGRDHLDIRKAGLTTRSAHGRPHPPKYGRADILRLAPGLIGGAGPLPGLTAAMLRALIDRAIKAADDIHATLHASAEAE